MHAAPNTIPIDEKGSYLEGTACEVSVYGPRLLGVTGTIVEGVELEAGVLVVGVRFIHDRDAVYGKDFADRVARLGFRTVRTPPRSPKANAVAERLVRTLRSELLDHVIILTSAT